MIQITLNKKDGNKVDAELKELDVAFIEKIMELQKEIYKGLINKDFYACSTQEEFEHIINGKGKILGCIEKEKNELVAIGVYVEYGYEEYNYGYDLQIQKEKLLKVGQIESTLVADNYRGNGLQKIICAYLEEMCKEREKEYICATVAPHNKYSLNTFLKLGYEIIVEKLKYGGLKRYVLMKKI